MVNWSLYKTKYPTLLLTFTKTMYQNSLQGLRIEVVHGGGLWPLCADIMDMERQTWQQWRKQWRHQLYSWSSNPYVKNKLIEQGFAYLVYDLQFRCEILPTKAKRHCLLSSICVRQIYTVPDVGCHYRQTSQLISGPPQPSENLVANAKSCNSM